MMPTERFLADKATLRAELERRARERKTIRQSEAVMMVGRSLQRLGQILDVIRAEEASHGRPDLGALVVGVSTGLPSFVAVDLDDRPKAMAVREAVFKAWAEPG